MYLNTFKLIDNLRIISLGNHLRTKYSNIRHLLKVNAHKWPVLVHKQDLSFDNKVTVFEQH